MAFASAHNTLVEDYSYICSSDPAVDSDRADFKDEWQRYADGAVESPPLRDGQEPTLFTLSHLRGPRIRAELQGIGKEDGFMSAAVAACALALRGAENFPGFKFSESRDSKGRRVASDECLAQLPYEVVIELGSVAMQRMDPSHD